MKWVNDATAGSPAVGTGKGKGRRRGSHPHGPRYELGAFLKSRHTGRESPRTAVRGLYQQEVKDSNPVAAGPRGFGNRSLSQEQPPVTERTRSLTRPGSPQRDSARRTRQG